MVDDVDPDKMMDRAMLKKDPNYQRLKFGGAGLAGVSSLWLAPDHLLVVEVSGYMEKYRRFYFRDVQALVVQSNSLRLWWSLGLGGMIAVLLFILFVVNLGAASPDQIMIWIFLVLMLCFAVPLGINLLRGPTCTVMVRTAVQTQKIPGLTRRKKAAQLLALLTPAITSAQGSLPGSSAAPAENYPG